MYHLRKTALICALLASSVSFGAMAQQGDVVNAEDLVKGKTEAVAADVVVPALNDAEVMAAEAADENIMKQKVSLARDMHKIQPVKTQVENALDGVALRLPEAERVSFVNAMRSLINYNAMERISVDAMVDTFTLLELKSMVEYYSKPEAKSASAKTVAWVVKVQPEISRMIDKAMMRIRTGGN